MSTFSRDAKEKCGLFGVFGTPDSVQLCYHGLYALQHRGQESAGIASTDGEHLQRYADIGLVSDVFNESILGQLAGKAAIGHVRYSTTGSTRRVNAQPLLVEYARGQVAVAHNGNLINARLLRDEYEAHGHIFQTSNDTEIILHLLAKPTHQDKGDPLAHVLNHIQGAFSLVFLFSDKVIAARDPYGIRPLCLGRLPDGSYVVASETCAFDIVDATYVREVEPGEILTLDKDGVHSRFFVEPGRERPAHCIFEHVYFADPSSRVYGENVHVVRKKMGAALAQESPVDADLVISVPDSGRSAAMGYSSQSRIPLERGFVRNHYVGRTFLKTSEAQRSAAVKLKLNVIRETVNGNRLVVVDDSIVRGTTTRGKMRALRDAGAMEIHLRISCPPHRHGCFYGIDFPSDKELVAHNRTVDEVRRFLEVDTLAYLSLERMLACAKDPPENYCTACWSGEYRIPVDHPVSKFSLERHQLRMFD